MRTDVLAVFEQVEERRRALEQRVNVFTSQVSPLIVRSSGPSSSADVGAAELLVEDVTRCASPGQEQVEPSESPMSSAASRWEPARSPLIDADSGR